MATDNETDTEFDNESKTLAMDVKIITAEANRAQAEAAGKAPRYELVLAGDGEALQVTINDPSQPDGDGRLVHTLRGSDESALRIEAEQWARDVNADSYWG